MVRVHHLTRDIALPLAATATATLLLLLVLVTPAFAVPGAVTGLTSTTHPTTTDWYSSNGPSFAWDPALSDGSAIAGYSCVLDQNATTEPDRVSDRNSLTYLPRVPYAVGSKPAESRIVDINGDGKPDLVVENYGSNTLSVLLGRGDGTLVPEVHYATGAGPWSLAIGDVNHDGLTDVVTGNLGDSSASVLISKGDGTFQPKADYTTGSGTNPECLRMGDVDGDGDLDIFTANASTNNVSILLNDGNGTFAAPTTFSTATHPTSIDLCDLDGDGKQDLATANYSAGNVSVLIGNGNGTFKNAVNYVASGNPQMVLAADLNGDGKPDLSTVNWGSNNASILLNNGNGTFKAAVNYGLGNGPFAFSVIDLNQDAAPDLVTTNNTASSVSILYGNGDGTFDPKKDLTCGSGPYFVALGDLNGDGYGDLITTDMNDNTVSVFGGTAFLGASYSGKADGVWYFHVRAVNASGVGGPTTTRELRIDATAPVTTDGSDPALAGDADSAWRMDAQTVTLSPTDSGGSGLVHTHYTLDGVQHTYSGPFEVSGNGSHALTWWSTDGAGNHEAPHSGWVNIDGDAPSSSDASTPALALDGDSAWRNAAQLVALSASDSGTAPASGLARIEYDLDGAGYVTYAAPFFVGTERSHTLHFRAVDRAGNVEDAHEAFVNIDLTPPTVSSSADADASWHRDDVDVTLSAGDGGGSGLAATQYRAGSGGSWADATDGSFTIPAAGVSGPVTYEYRAVDRAGNETSGSCTVNFDATAPATSDDYAGGSAWQTGPVSFLLTSHDAASGVAETTWAVDGGAPQGGTDVTVSGDGKHTVTYFSTDNAGNAEDAHSVTVRIDATAPATTDGSDPALAGDGARDWRAAGQTVSFAAADAGGSGLGRTFYTLDRQRHQYEGPFVVAGDGSHPITWWSTDAAGNTEAAHHGWVNVWGTPPTISASAVVSGSPTDGWLKSDPQPVSLTATGGHGGATIHYVVDGGAQVDVVGAAADFSVTGEGGHVVTYWATDALGNEESQHTGHVNIDTVAPVTSDDYAGGSAWQTGPVSFLLTSHDAASGVAETTWAVDGGAPQGGTDVTVSGDGKHTVTYFSTDNAGNAEDAHSVTVRIDAGAPATHDGAPAGWQKAETTVTLSPADLLSGMTGGLAGTSFEIDGGAPATGTSVVVLAPSDHSGDGPHLITYRSTDAVGNREPDKTATVLIDTLAPDTRDDVAAGPPAHTDPLTVTLSPSDANGELDVSGVATTRYKVDDGSWQTGTSVEVTGDGPHTVSYYSTDNAGNDEDVRVSPTMTIGTTPPGASSDDAPAGWVSHPVTLTITPGARAVSTTWELDGGLTQTGISVFVDAPASHANDGAHAVTYRSSTIGDVSERTRTAVVRIDTAAPETSVNVPPGWQHGPVTLTLSPADASSGIAQTTWTVDGGALQHGTSVLVSGDGAHAVTYFSTDNAGNVEGTQSATVRIDDTAPQVVCDQAGHWFKSKSVTPTFTAADAGSGLQSVAYRLDQGGWQAGTSVALTGAGPHALSYKATDANGNVSTGTCTVGIDTKRPKMTRGLTSKGKQSGKLTLRFKITDAKPSCGAATVTRIVVSTASGKKVATIKGTGATVATNKNVKYTAVKKLTRGSYRFRVYVVDIAGNKGRRIVPGKLVVR